MANPAREALARAVNRAIAEGAPVYTNRPDPEALIRDLWRFIEDGGSTDEFFALRERVREVWR